MKFEFELDEVNIIIAGLAELPAKTSMNTIKSIQDQAASQLQPEMKSADEE